MPDESNRLNDATRAVWDANADYWSQRMGEGNDFHRLLIEPNELKLLALKPGDIVLDVACGNGQFARKLASLGASVVAVDFAPRMIENAKARTAENTERIEYRVLDATDGDALLSLGERRFDAAVCTMGIMDIADIVPLFSTLPRLLKPHCPFVFAVCHPCFNMTGPNMRMMAESEENNAGIVTRHALSISGYIRPQTSKGVAMVGMEPHYYFHRPISQILNLGFVSGFVVDGFEEPAFDLPASPTRPFDWANFQGIPPVLVVRMRLSA
jgi:2-polyprenyl-3-methyl-5-hydroxy-6-metoxy-1,4-benzoquinol methylase